MYFNTGDKSHFLDGAEWTIGRHVSNDIVIPDPTVSRYHAVLRRSGLIFTVEDLDSTQGSMVNRKPIKSSELLGKEEIQLATVKCRLSSQPNTEPRRQT